MSKGHANEIGNGKANQRDKESIDTNNSGGFRYSLSDTVRLNNKIELIIKDRYALSNVIWIVDSE
jgi:hypothetical protein